MQDRQYSTPFVLDRIEHVLLLVNGMDAAVAFYERVLGAAVESRLPRYGMAELRVGDSHLDLVDTSADAGAWARPPVSGGRNVDHIAIRLRDASSEEVRRHLEAHGVAIAEERREDGPGGETASFYVRDPSGNTIELMGLAVG